MATEPAPRISVVRHATTNLAPSLRQYMAEFLWQYLHYGRPFECILSASLPLPLPLSAMVESQTFDSGDSLSTKITRKGQPPQPNTIVNPQKTSIR